MAGDGAMDDQGRRTSSAVLLFFGASTPYSLLLPVRRGFPYQAGRLLRSTSIPALSSVCSSAGLRLHGIPTSGADAELAPQSPTGIQPVTGAHYLMRRYYSRVCLTLQRLSLEPLKVLFTKDSKENVRL